VSAKYNLVCEQATTFNFQFQIKEDETPWNLTNYSVEMTVRPFMGATSTTVVASTDNGYISLDPTQGRVTVTIPYTVTENFNPSRQVYDLIFDSGTEVTRILEGTFVVTQAVTIP
jgi:hypothetical protein